MHDQNNDTINDMMKYVDKKEDMTVHHGIEGERGDISKEERRKRTKRKKQIKKNKRK